jgi:hypothetical protein
MNRRNLIAGVGAGLAAPAAFADAPSTPALEDAARDAWLYVLPLIELAALRARPQGPSGRPRPLNTLFHARELATPSRRAVTAPNNDTLYSTAFIDTTDGPVRLEIPQAHGRYLSVQVLDMYTDNNFILSPRTPGGAAGDWRLISPRAAPKGPRDLQLATPHAWINIRTLVDGPADLPAAHAIQDRMQLTGPAAGAPTAPATRDSDWSAYFKAAGRLLQSDPPRFRKGLEAFELVRGSGQRADFDPAGYSAQQVAAIQTGVVKARQVVQGGGGGQRFVAGWTYPRPDLGDFGDNFTFRAIVANTGLAALKPTEAMYMRPEGDGAGLFHGDGLYRLTLTQPIPVDGFWSLTMYQPTPTRQNFLVENELGRYSVGDRTRGLIRGPNGELDIWIGRSNPGAERVANWLPAPSSGPYTLSLRAYLPRPALLSGDSRLPAIVAV